MKYTFVTLILFSCFTINTLAQKGLNEFEKTRVEAILDEPNSIALNKVLKGDDGSVVTTLQAILRSHALQLNNVPGTYTTTKGSQNSMISLSDLIDATITNINKGENAAVVVVYRDIVFGTSAVPTKIDFTSLKTIIIHKNKDGSSFSNYLLATKNIFFVFIDVDDDFYANQAENEDKKLSNTIIKINYKTSFFKKSFQDTKNVWQGVMGGNPITSTPRLKITLVEVNSQRIKDPCDVIASNKTIEESRLTFPIHEKNLASFQIGVENTKYALNNFSIEDGNLVVKPNEEQKEAWKSSLYSIIEIHLPRDIDNFNPIWKDVFGKGRGRSFGQYIHDAIFQRIGIYGGIKISKDPLSNLYSGFNFAITKELSVNLGWTWTNQINPQVTNIGEITSLDDAKEYAQRSYTVGKFSWGLSFSPSAIVDMFKSK
ncbi:hypothetical protein QTN47_21205 [Danxiaibacter flavus]|uniref:Uncharacterized protein n=1 Tax=Danxiaibacter flavus TaxID=3049108 RepID=A0ABV3ZJH5_9BACT|nr:hypothetical protein QNM32_21210 [Chitinophagaceae bacterium DXS]